MSGLAAHHAPKQTVMGQLQQPIQFLPVVLLHLARCPAFALWVETLLRDGWQLRAEAAAKRSAAAKARKRREKAVGASAVRIMAQKRLTASLQTA